MKIIHLLTTLGLLTATLAAEPDLTLWYSKPATNVMNEALPVGNGRIGMLITGVPERERLVLNEDSLWTGDANPSGNYDTMGAYQVLGNLHVNLPEHKGASDYRRALNISDAIASVSYRANGVHYQREYFCSAPAQCLAVKFTADKPGALTGSIEPRDGHDAKPSFTGSGFTVSGTLKNGLRYEWQAAVVHQGGRLSVSGDKLEFQNCDSLLIFITAGTDYALDAARQFRGEAPGPVVSEQLKKAAGLDYGQLKAAHIADYRALFDRVSLDLGASTPEQLAQPTNLRKRAAVTQPDPGLAALLFQHGRYLLISCSRPGGLPANLQGLWNDSNQPMWHSDYHTNINVQMNYWPAETAGLPECFQPFADLVASQLPVWRLGRPRGWALRTSHNIFGGMGWHWDMTANAWYCSHFWEHYQFTQDAVFLRNTAYPLMKETCEFWEERLRELPDGRLVVPDGWSPEHGPREDGVAYHQQIVWDLFDNYAAAARVLNLDREHGEKIAALRDRLAVTRAGSWGQLLEWLHEKKGQGELDTPGDHHRHTSHLFAVFPGHQFSPERTPELIRAAKVTLDARGTDDRSDVREWSLAWRAALYARMRDGDNAGRLVTLMLADRHTCPNLFGLHPPMQIDGNLGITAAMAEMLLQSSRLEPAGWELELLPALPAAWQDGTVSGLKARGGFAVAMQWRDGRLAGVEIKNLAGNPCRVRYGQRMVELNIPKGETRTLGGSLMQR